MALCARLFRALLPFRACSGSVCAAFGFVASLARARFVACTTVWDRRTDLAEIVRPVCVGLRGMLRLAC